jgi:asparaginyl-tRNA synthetase
MDLAEEFTKYLTAYALDACADDIELFAKFVDNTLISNLNHIVSTEFKRITYTEAVEILRQSGVNFDFEISFGKDLQSEHERFLAEKYFKSPVIIVDYPKTIKPFYMRLNDDGITVAAMDVIVPGIGEIIGGSQREERLENLERRMEESGLSKEAYWWYLDSRRFGTVAHSGFGLGFERLMMMITGVTNIRDVIPFPRTPKSIEF